LRTEVVLVLDTGRAIGGIAHSTVAVAKEELVDGTVGADGLDDVVVGGARVQGLAVEHVGLDADREHESRARV